MKKQFKIPALLMTVIMLMSLLTGCFSQVSMIQFNDDGTVLFSSAQYVLEKGLDDNNLTPEQYYSEQLRNGGKLESIEIKGNKYWGVTPEPVLYESLTEFLAGLEDNNLISAELVGGGIVIDYKVESFTYRGESQSEDGSLDLIPEEYQPMMVDRLVISFPRGEYDEEYGLIDLNYPEENESLISLTDNGRVVILEMGLASEEYHVQIAGGLKQPKQLYMTVESVDIGIPMPMPGYKTGNVIIAPPECQPENSCSVMRFEDKYFTWYLNDGSEDWKELDYDDEFEAGEQYGVRFCLLPGERYCFDPSITEIRVNGEPAMVRGGLEGIYVISYKFDPLPTGKKKLTTPFNDVSASDYYYESVVWAYNADPQITDGNGKDKFMPDKTCTRGQVVTFLWRACGCPEPKSDKCPFTDVKKDDYFYKPVLWAVEKGITEGTTATTFSPEKTCTNAHILTFLYRAVGAGDDGWYQEALNWAKSKGILGDSYSSGYDVKADCPRKDVVYYLFNFAQSGHH